MAGDDTAQIATNGLIDVSSIELLIGFGFSTSPNGELRLNATTELQRSIFTSGGRLTQVSTLTISNNAQLQLLGTGNPPSTYLHLPTQFLIFSYKLDLWYKYYQDLTTLNTPITIVCNNMTVDSSSSITALGTGYSAASGYFCSKPLKIHITLGPGAAGSGGWADTPGGSHAGQGGLANRGGIPVGNAYGIVNAPVALGSGGGKYF